MMSSSAPGYRSVRFGDGDDEDTDIPPRLHPVILKTVQNMYRTLAPSERVPARLDGWYHSAILYYRIDPISIKLVVVEGDNTPTFVMPETRFELVTTAASIPGVMPESYLEDAFAEGRGRLPEDMSADFQVVRAWVLADIECRGLNKPAAVAARAAEKVKKQKATAEDWEKRLKDFYERVGIDKPIPKSNQRSCPKCYTVLQTCTGCRIICCIQPECVSEVDDAKGCVKHPKTVYCGKCRNKLSKTLPELMNCLDCSRTYCRVDFSWCIAPPTSTSPTSHSPDAAPKPTTTASSESAGTRLHEPKAICPARCGAEDSGLRCCNPKCWSVEPGGTLANLLPRTLCSDCGPKWDGESCAGQHLWLCGSCSLPANMPANMRECDSDTCELFSCDRCKSTRIDGKTVCANCQVELGEDAEEYEEEEEPDAACTQCGLWLCGPCSAGPSAEY
ncbi:hypothetical protein C8R46DRAFT_441000 [Mycena filopes]|nr:hypothetical protein C8R46DRAFT_441000 [Mycena filopes]